MRTALNPLGVGIMAEVFTGAICASASSNVPKGWLLCNGQAVSRTTYSKLFAEIGTKYGTGNGSSTFNVPNLNQKFPEMDSSKTLGTSVAAGLPNISGEVSSAYGKTKGGTATGSFTYTDTSGKQDGGSGSDGEVILTSNITFNASTSNSIYGKSTTVQPPALIINWFIKT